MTTPISRSVPGFGGTPGLAELTTGATQTLLAQNPGIKTIDAQLGRDQARLSAIGKLALALDEFRDGANKLTGDKLAMAASVSGKAFTAVLKDAKTASGSHAIEVKQLAQGQQLATKALPDKGAALGTGAPTLIKIDMGTGSGATSKTLRIENGNNTLDGIAKAMRDAGLDAKVVQDGKGYSLSLTGAPGAANTMRIGVSGDPALQALFAYGPDVKTSLTQKSPAQDAQLTVDGKAVTSSSNQLDTAIPGMSIKLTATGKGEVKVASDPAAMAGNVKAFVGALNTLMEKMGNQKTGDAASDVMSAQISKQFDSVLGGADAKTLADLGITRRNGKLTLDETKLKAAVEAAPDKVSELFGKPNTGLAAQLAARTTQLLSSQGVLASQAATVQKDVDKLTAQKTQIANTVSRQASALVQQYAMAGTGGSSLFGQAGSTGLSLFDYI
jgi:flagellar hook-associated protein 2